jgi:hypothetical protein
MNRLQIESCVCFRCVFSTMQSQLRNRTNVACFRLHYRYPKLKKVCTPFPCQLNPSSEHIPVAHAGRESGMAPQPLLRPSAPGGKMHLATNKNGLREWESICGWFHSFPLKRPGEGQRTLPNQQEQYVYHYPLFFLI